MTDWNTGWTPPGTEPSPDPSTTAQDTGWDWSWLGQSQGSAKQPGEIFPGVDVGVLLRHVFPEASPEEQLAQLILDKMGGSVQVGKVSTQNAVRIQIARQAAHRAMQDPAYREQLAQSMGWNLKNPHVAYFIAHGNNLPSDPMGSGLTPEQTAAAAKAKTAAGPPATIGAPFDPKAWGGRAGDPGFTYGAVLPPDIAAAAGVSQQWGVDYALPLGAGLPSPFTGTVQEADFNGPYGNTVVVKMANGYTYRVAHLSAMNVKKGDVVAVGQELGLVGSTGNSTGPHVLIEMRDATGKPIDPTPIMDSLLKGDNTGAQKYMSDYVTAAAAVGGPFLTSDGHLIYPGSQDYDVFFAAQQLWRKRYGGDPPWSFVSSLIAQGNTTTEQITSAMDQMSSDVPNMNWGQRDTLTNDVNSFAQKAWDRPVPDALVKQLAALGITTPGQVQGWIQSHPASALDPGTYAQYFDVANPHTQQLWQQPPSPDLIAHIHDQMQKGPQGG